MSVYQIMLPPELPGIYRITNKGSQHAYIGSTSNLRARLRQWQLHLANQTPDSLRLINAAGPNVEPEGWAMTVIEILPGATADYLVGREGYHLRNEAITRQGKILNTIVSLAAKVDTNALTEIFTDNGVPLSYEDAARLAGYTNMASLQQRLARLRSRGVTKVNISELANPGRGRPRR